MRRFIRQLREQLETTNEAASRVLKMKEAIERARAELVDHRRQNLTKEPIRRSSRQLELVWHDADNLGLWAIETLMQNWLDARRSRDNRL